MVHNKSKVKWMNETNKRKTSSTTTWSPRGLSLFSARIYMVFVLLVFWWVLSSITNYSIHILITPNVLNEWILLRRLRPCLFVDTSLALIWVVGPPSPWSISPSQSLTLCVWTWRFLCGAEGRILTTVNEFLFRLLYETVSFQIKPDLFAFTLNDKANWVLVDVICDVFRLWRWQAWIPVDTNVTILLQSESSLSS